MKIVRGGAVAAFDAAAARPSPPDLEPALLRHAHELECCAGRTRNGDFHDQLVEDRACVLDRLEVSA